MNIQELETVKRLNLPIKMFVLDNSGYGSIRSTQKIYFDNFLVASDSASGLTFPKLAKIAEAYSIPFFEINDSHDIRKKIVYNH